MGGGPARVCLVAATLACVARAGSAVAGETSAAMRAYVDPRTGRLTAEPPTGRTVPPASGALSRSSVGLAEMPAPGGGYMIHLQGRFQSPLVATVGADGAVHVGHGEAGE